MIFNLLSKAKDLFYNNVLSQLKSTNVQDAIDEVSSQLSGQIQTATGSALALTDSSGGYLMNISAEGKSEQNGTPTPSTPIAILNSGECVELQNGYYNSSGVYTSSTQRIASVNMIPCTSGDTLKVVTDITDIVLVYVFYDSNKAFLSTLIATNGVGTVPTNAKYFHFYLAVDTSEGITPSTVGKVELTINNKYVLQIKSESKNLLNNTATSQTINGVTLTVNSDKSITAKGTATKAVDVLLGYADVMSGENYIVSGVNGGSSTTYYAMPQKYLNDTWVANTWVYNETTCAVDNTYNKLDYRLCIASGVTVDTTFYPMIRKAEYDNTYVPHAKNTSTILLNEPIRAVNDVKDIIEYVDNGYKVRRKIKSDVVTEYLHSTELTNCMRIGLRVSMYGVDATGGQICNMSTYRPKFSEDYEHFYIVDYVLYLFVKKETCGTTVDEMKNWIANNTIVVQYEMPNEVIEDIADQTPFYSVPTYEGGTTISTTDRVQPVLIVDYPVSDTAGVASKGYAKANEVSQSVAELSLKTDTLAENIKTINNRCKVIEATVQLDGGSAAGLHLFMPEGWNALNSVILAVNYMYSDSGGVSNYNMYESSGIHYPQVFISGESITIQFAGYDPTTPKSVDVKIVLMRTDV